MFSLLLAVRQLVKAIRFAWQDAAFRVLALVTASVLTAGTIFYHLVEGWRWLDSLYFCVITLATIGFGDFTPQTDLGKIFTIVYVFIGIGLLVAVFTRLADAMLVGKQAQVKNKTEARQRGTSPLDSDR